MKWVASKKCQKLEKCLKTMKITLNASNHRLNALLFKIRVEILNILCDTEISCVKYNIFMCLCFKNTRFIKY